jgi:hypothetical protein
MNVYEQQEVVAEVLTKIKALIDSEAIVAGGAPRNWKQGELANDIDLYLRSNCINTSNRFQYQIKQCLGIDKLETYQDVDVSQYTFGINLKIVKLLGVKYKGVDFQFIVMDPNVNYDNFKMQIVNHMDIGLNRCWCDWYCKQDLGDIRTTKEFEKDFANKELTLYTYCMTASQLEHCMKVHLPKMQKYYPKYQLKIC